MQPFFTRFLVLLGVIFTPAHAFANADSGITWSRFSELSYTLPDTAICLGNSVLLHAQSNGLNPNNNLPASFTTGLSAWLPFNGDANDQSGNNNNGTVVGATLTLDRFNNPNSAYSFNGVSDFISIFKSNTLNTKLMDAKTISVWFKALDSGNALGSYIFRYGTTTRNSATGEELIWGSNKDAKLHLNNFSERETTYLDETSNPLSLNQWHMATVVLNYLDNTVEWYIDGVLFNSYSTTLFKALNPIVFIGSHTNETLFFNGLIDDFGVWERALDVTEIQNLYQYSSNQVNYNWSTGDTTENILVSPTQPTYYSFVASNGLNSISDSVLVRPISGVIPVVKVNASSQCVSNQFFVFTDSIPSSDFPAVQKLWYTSGATTDTISGDGPVSFAYTSAGDYSVNLQITNSLGCISESNYNNNVRVIGLPTATIASTDASGNTANDGKICSGDFIGFNTLTTNPGVGASSLSYRWLLNGSTWPQNDSTNSSVGANFTSNGTADTYLVGLELSNDYGCVSIANDSTSAISIIINPIPTASFITPLIGAQSTIGSDAVNGNGGQLLCSGSVLFQGNASIGSGSISRYVWDFGDGSSSVQSDTAIVSHVYPVNNGIQWSDPAYPNTQYMVSVTAISNEGCSHQASAPREVKNGPEAKIGLLGSAVQNYKKNLYIFKNLSENVHPSYIINSFWDFGDGTTSTRTHVAPKKYELAGSYEVSLVVLANTGCTDTTLYTIELSTDTNLVQNNCGATAQFNVLNQDSIQLIAGNKFTFINISTHKEPGWTLDYLWDFGDGSPQRNNGSIYNKTFEDTGTFEVTLTAVSSFGCSHSVVKKMQVLPTFYANFNHTPNTCGSTKVAFANTSLWDSTYTWYFGDGTTSNEKNPTHTYPTAGKYKVTLSINNGKSFKTKEIYVAANPTTNGIQSQLQSCGNLYIFSTAALGQNLSYFWSFSGGYGSLENSPAVGRLFGDTSAQVVNLTVASDGRCFTVVPSLLIQPLPSIESGIVADFSTQMIQEGLCKTGIQFTNSSTNATQYKWVFGDGAVSPIVSKLNTFHAYPTAGVYQVSLIAINKQGCSDTLTKMLTVIAGGYATPVSDFSTDYPIQCISDHRFDFVNNSSLTGFGWVPKFYWDFGDGTFDRENTFTYGKKFKGPGDYLITLVAESNYGCRDTTSKWIKVVPNSECTPLMMREKNDGQLGNSDITYLGQSQTTGTASVRKENATISLFPNPNNGSFTLLSTLNIEQGTTFQIIDILGREAFATQSFQVSSNERKFIFEDLSQGTYLMLISLPSGQTQRLTFVISR